MSRLRLSPSMIKSYWNYKDKEECGIMFEQQYVSRTEIQKAITTPMEIGRRFEYLASGALQRDGSVPPPLLTEKTRKPSADNSRVYEQAGRFRLLFDKKGYELESVQEKLVLDRGNYDLVNVLDIVFFENGVKGIIDLKSTGLLTNKWEDTGWAPERLHQKKKLLIQAACNIITAREIWLQEYIPYYFYVASSTNDVDVGFYEMHFSERALAEYDDLIEDAAISIEVEDELGFTPFPDHKRCAECPLMATCQHATDLPIITKIFIDTQKQIL